ncbi:MAG: peptidylprolyl isomerase, partial [Lentisphaeria bacterium]|nr:peptidylprolyl isomerase [Lentisphaeria bacterium]
MANPIIRIVTGKGDMDVELFEDKVPNTVANVIELAEAGFYK